MEAKRKPIERILFVAFCVGLIAVNLGLGFLPGQLRADKFAQALTQAQGDYIIAAGRLSEAQHELEYQKVLVVEYKNLVATLKRGDTEEQYYRAFYDLCYAALTDRGAGQADATGFCLSEIASMYDNDWYGKISPGWDWEQVK